MGGGGGVVATPLRFSFLCALYPCIYWWYSYGSPLFIDTKIIPTIFVWRNYDVIMLACPWKLGDRKEIVNQSMDTPHNFLVTLRHNRCVFIRVRRGLFVGLVMWHAARKLLQCLVPGVWEQKTGNGGPLSCWEMAVRHARTQIASFTPLSNHFSSLSRMIMSSLLNYWPECLEWVETAESWFSLELPLRCWLKRAFIDILVPPTYDSSQLASEHF